jgi:hypothetical protein
VSPEDAFEICDAATVPRTAFRKDGATRFAVADFRPSCEQPDDIRTGRLAANAIVRLLREHLLQVVAEEEGDRSQLAEGIEVVPLRCVVNDEAAAERVGEAMGADLVIWGDAMCPLRSAKGEPLVTMIQNVTIDAKGHSTINTGKLEQKAELAKDLLKDLSGSFCAHAALTAHGWPALPSGGKDESIAATDLWKAGLDLPQVVGGEALGLVERAACR